MPNTKSSKTSKAYRLGYFLYHSVLPLEIKTAWYRLLPTLNQDQLKELLDFLEEAAKEKKKLEIAKDNEWKRLELEHEAQMGGFLKGIK